METIISSPESSVIPVVANIFKKIVPAGKGEVVLVLPEDVNELEKDDDVGILEAIGLEIEVSFTGI